MKQYVTAEKPRADVKIKPGPLYPDRCLECLELAVETYGGVRQCRCIDCFAASRVGRNRLAIKRARVGRAA